MNTDSKPTNILPTNFVVVDCETSGLNPAKHSLLSIGAETARGNTFYAECAPREGAECDPAAMAINGMDWETCKEYARPPSAIVMALVEWLEVEAMNAGLPAKTRWVMGGKNPQFDYGFLLESLRGIWLDRNVCAKELRISRRCVDLHSLAYGWAISRGLDIAHPDFSTDVIYAHLGFQKEAEPHHALAGAKLEMEVFRVLLPALAADHRPKPDATEGPRPNLIIAGDVHYLQNEGDEEPEVVPYGLLIECATVKQVKDAMATGKLEFTVFGGEASHV